MSGRSIPNPIEAAFQQAVRDFRAKVKDEVYQQILATRSIDDVYDATDKIQKEQAREGHLRHLKKIEPFLENLREYAAVVEVFLQVKPDVLALIWGPVKLLLQWTKVLKQSFDAITNTLCEIGNLLPEFKKMAVLFEHKPQINHVLLLFFRDILEFYVVALKFFGLPRWSIFFESMWPRHQAKIKVIIEHIEQHKSLLRNEVRLEEVEAAHQARLRELEHFKEVERAHRHQEYHAIRQYISPTSYAEKLYRLSVRACLGTDKWLTMDAQYQKWINVTDLTTNLLWLQGIPGAGKTFLSGLIAKQIEQTKPVHPIAYVFLSYSQVNDTSALSVLQSLLFHLAEGNEDIQETLCRSSRTNLKSDIEMTFNLLATSVAFLGLVFIVVDGLDEMQERERRVLLRQLLRLSETCKEVKLLVSSRAESDITLELKGKPTIRLDSGNATGIERFVQENAKEWFQNSQFPSEMQSEIRSLLAPLPSSSKGMFLYARIVLDSVKELDALDDIRSELRVLPASLDEAYARIFDRINKSKPVFKQKARKLLSWVGCSPMPLTIQELEAALLIKHDRHDIDGDHSLAGTLDVTKFCGPIVEVVDEFVQFVHFTVKEYIFSSEIPDHINIADATLELAVCCIFYLRQYHHDLDRTDDAIAQSILSGVYRLHNFSKVTWYQLVETYIVLLSPRQISPKLLDQLEFFMSEKWIHTEVEEQKLMADPTSNIWSFLEKDSPRIYDFLCVYKKFHGTLTSSEFSINKADWTQLDPTSISQLSVRLHKQMNKLLSDAADRSVKANRASIERYYGKRPFKCGFVNCTYHRYGFESHASRKAHTKNHECPWTCSILNCDFASQGFLSRKMRDEHMNLFHGIETPTAPVSLNVDDGDLSALLLDLIETNQVEHVRSSLLQDENYITSSRTLLSEIYDRAARASLEMLQLVHQNILTRAKAPYRLKKEIFTAQQTSAKTNNLETFHYASTEYFACLCKTKIEGADISLLTTATLSSDDPQVWEDGYSILQSQNFRNLRIVTENTYLWGEVIDQVVGHDSKPKMLSKVWKLLIDRGVIDRTGLNELLSGVVRTSTLTCLAEFCLDHGADINYRRAAGFRTSLQFAVQRSSVEAAAMIQMLLFRGADPNLDMEGPNWRPGSNRSTRRIRDEKGAQNIQKWLGKTWDELVAEAEAHLKQQAEKVSRQ